MPLLGQAAMLLGFDIEAPTIAEHDDWHTHEHMAERLAIPGSGEGAELQAGAGADAPQPLTWLAETFMPTLPERRGLASVHLLEGALAAAMTSEQRIRSADRGVDWALLATGYEPKARAELERGELGAAALAARGAMGASTALYQAMYSLTAAEVGVARASLTAAAGSA